MYVKYTGWSFIIDQVHSDLLEIIRIFSEGFCFIADIWKTLLVNPANTVTLRHIIQYYRLTLANSNENNKKIRKIKILRIFLSVGHPRDPKGEGLLWLGKEYKYLKTMLKNFLNNFKKVQKTTFLTTKMTKIWMSIWSKMVNFWTHFLFLSPHILPSWFRKKIKIVFPNS